MPQGALKAGQTIIMGTEVDTDVLSFYNRLPSESKVMAAEGLDASMLTTDIASGFIGTHAGLHARITNP